MASLIKSPDLANGTFVLGSPAPAVESLRPTVSEASKPAEKTRIVEPAATKLFSSVANTVSDAEVKISKRIEEAVALKKTEIEERYKAEQETIFAAAAERGYEEGSRQAIDDLKKSQQLHAESIVRLQTSIEGAISKAFEDVTDLARDIAFEAVLKLLGQEIASGSAILATVKDAVSRIEESGSMVLRLHPDDAKLLHAADAEATSPSFARYHLEVDDTITRGGCLVESANGILDARLETKLDAFLQALRGRASEHPEALP